jgi:hypothetical protein
MVSLFLVTGTGGVVFVADSVGSCGSTHLHESLVGTIFCLERRLVPVCAADSHNSPCDIAQPVFYKAEYRGSLFRVFQSVGTGKSCEKSAVTAFYQALGPIAEP